MFFFNLSVLILSFGSYETEDDGYGWRRPAEGSHETESRGQQEDEETVVHREVLSPTFQGLYALDRNQAFSKQLLGWTWALINFCFRFSSLLVYQQISDKEIPVISPSTTYPPIRQTSSCHFEKIKNKIKKKKGTKLSENWEKFEIKHPNHMSASLATVAVIYLSKIINIF